MIKNKKIYASILFMMLFLLSFSSVNVKGLSHSPITLMVNDSLLQSDIPPQIIDKRIFVPIRVVSEAFGMKVSWNDEEQQVMIIGDAVEMTLSVNETDGIVNEEMVTIDVPVQLWNDRVLVPIRFISESFGATVDWDETTYTVSIYMDTTVEDDETNGTDETNESNGINDDEEVSRDYRQDMRDFVISISKEAKRINPNFIVIPQNGGELLTEDEEEYTPALSYIQAIDGVGREDLFYGYEDDNKATPEDEKEYMLNYLHAAKDNGLSVLVIDYCSTKSFMDASYAENKEQGFISYAADRRELDHIPEYPESPYGVNEEDILSLDEAKNFLFYSNPQFANKDDFLKAIQETNYDLVVIDAYFQDELLTSADVTSLKTKKNGGKRLVLAYMSIGEAEDYRYYWDKEWETNPPEWLTEENPYWEGNYKVKYWDQDWQQYIYGNEDSYLSKIISSEFDGVYLDIIDAFWYFENLEE